jgi:hypothetical protein
MLKYTNSMADMSVERFRRNGNGDCRNSSTLNLRACFFLCFTSYFALKYAYITVFNSHGNGKGHFGISAFRQSGNGSFEQDYDGRWMRRGGHCRRTLKLEDFSNIHCGPSGASVTSQKPISPSKKYRPEVVLAT